MRLDLYIASKFNKTRTQAQSLIKDGQILVNDKVELKPSFNVENQTVVIVEDLPFVSRGGMKLLDAIQSFNLDLTNKIMADIGSSTGGFTDCALKHGIQKVYAYDVGTDQLHQSLRNDLRVISFEQTNILDVTLSEDVNFVTIDVSFTSVKPILAHLKQKALYVVLVKPQFEVGIKDIKKGIVKDKLKQKMVLEGIIQYANNLGFKVLAQKPSDLLGKMGNQEYFLLLEK